MIDARLVKVHHTAARVGQKGGTLYRTDSRWIAFQPHAVCDGNGRPVRIALTEGQRSDDDGARVLVADLLVAKLLLADTAYDADWAR